MKMVMASLASSIARRSGRNHLCLESARNGANADRRAQQDDPRTAAQGTRLRFDLRRRTSATPPVDWSGIYARCATARQREITRELTEPF